MCIIGQPAGSRSEEIPQRAKADWPWETKPADKGGLGQRGRIFSGAENRVLWAKMPYFYMIDPMYFIRSGCYDCFVD